MRIPNIPPWNPKVLKQPALAVHPFLTMQLHETNHELLADENALDDNPEATPGHNACAVCARVSKGPLIPCPICCRVQYCSKKHLKQDELVHVRSCLHLQYIKAAEDLVEVDEEMEAQLVAHFPTTLKRAQPLSSWADVVPQHFKAAWSTGLSKASSTPSPPSPPPDKSSPAWEPFQLAVHLAVATSILSYPYTLLHWMDRKRDCLRSTLDGAEKSGGPLVVCVLGASDSAELAQPQVWRALGAAASSGVVLQFVGPEVPQEKHGMVQQPTARVQLAFWKEEYSSLLKRVHAEKAGLQVQKQEQNVALPQPLTEMPNLFVGYNMGLTCPDYDWIPTIKAIQKSLGAGGPSTPIPLIATTNTALEASMEQEMLVDMGWTAASAPHGNPFTSLEPLQSGTLGNDTYRKNSYVACYRYDASSSGKRPPKGKRDSKEPGKRRKK